ncbi:regulator of cell morphogenesis and NO signaling [Parabacteroides sp. PF5-5]|uniref:iron-sulfur cluster repair di-iron protein n=1 Tax=Bacteroidales TaxID=171549 RepID=UPI0003675345|nr:MULTISPECIES: iron-sulfur cluster repair di-iron protein [Bacteroidales]EOA56181.1 iron-sulfur cluster repair di-iron protein [Bacteroides sp. HPS0048]KKB53035.1 iron-sulfur cluster repair di-iron protein [Parabacteroides sp. HGS0025]MDH6304041.1 regulator of cell morphogenesis and NO signaling [Parabacteroides sp. PH5-39]MDH6315244.1 regulator of cell morphogenesis and NO signaling [Parabacteroides sp. PF5-13]MDH6318904.1 regulator of cell morphogenesis and NO signaling [Parabacteroides sp
MNKNYKDMTVGQIVADKFDNSKVFNDFGIDFCCRGDVSLSNACNAQGIDIKDVLKKLGETEPFVDKTMDFKTWDIDLLVDFIIKHHHRYIRKNGRGIQELLNKVCDVHGNKYNSLYEVKALFDASLTDLNEHLNKEEQILFPYIYEMHEAYSSRKPLPFFHCGGVEQPIAVMMSEHDTEGSRFREISRLTNTYLAPDDACESYRLVLNQLNEFEENLHHHIHLENNIVFPAAIQIQLSFNF